MDQQAITTDVQKLEAQLASVQLPGDLAQKATDLIHRASQSLTYGGNINQFEIISKYIDWITSLPWNTKTGNALSIAEAKTILDASHYGLADIKKRILEYVSVLAMQKDNKDIMSTYHAPILFFVGLAGTGKTTFARSVAQTLGRPFIRIPFGGLSSAADLYGLSRVNNEATPGLIIKALRRVKYANPIILLDEIDRVTPEAKAGVMGVLIELLDPEQNSNFIDHYIDYPVDLSQIIFIATGNNTSAVSTAVMDRLEVIHMPSYTDEEKVQIAKNYMFPRMVKEIGLAAGSIVVDDVIWQKIARLSGYDPGLRSIERRIETIVRRVAYKIVNGEGTEFVINDSTVKDYLEQM